MGSYGLAPWLRRGPGAGLEELDWAQDRISEDGASTPGPRSSMGSGQYAQALVCLEGS